MLAGSKMPRERTFIMIKPDGVQRGLVSKIIARFEEKGFKLCALKFMQADEALLKEHYGDLSSKPFFAVSPPPLPSSRASPVVSRRVVLWARIKAGAGTGRNAIVYLLEIDPLSMCQGLVEYMKSGPVVPMVWEGDGVVKAGRTLLGATKPSDSLPGSIRGDYCIDVGRNICHGSDAVESAQKEIALWFKPEEVCDWAHHSEAWVYEK